MSDIEILGFSEQLDDCNGFSVGLSRFTIDLLEWHRRLRSANRPHVFDPLTHRLAFAQAHAARDVAYFRVSHRQGRKLLAGN